MNKRFRCYSIWLMPTQQIEDWLLIVNREKNLEHFLSLLLFLYEVTFPIAKLEDKKFSNWLHYFRSSFFPMLLVTFAHKISFHWIVFNDSLWKCNFSEFLVCGCVSFRCLISSFSHLFLSQFDLFKSIFPLSPFSQLSDGFLASWFSSMHNVIDENQKELIAIEIARLFKIQ